MDSVRALVARVAGDAGAVRAEGLAGRGVAEFECADGVLVLRGSDPVAASVAFSQYLKKVMRRRITWDQPRIEAGTWPDAVKTRVTTPFTIRYYLNVVTYGYSTAFWDWERWEQEIDWMALHGVTHPLMQIGHEAVITELLRRNGLSLDRTAEWIGSAAHFPWTWMGNTNTFGGPLSAGWIARHVELAQKVLERQRELGMTPILPMFGGHVPPELAGDSAGELEWQGWRTPLLSPDSPRFAELAGQFLGIQRELFGTGHHYAADPFIESVPPSDDPGYLASVGRAVYQAMAAGDPEATWVLQGWPFHYQRDFWTPQRVQAFLSEVPQERLVLLDLWGEHAPMWQRDNMFGRRWVWCAVHNFGGRFALFGDLQGLRRDVAELPTGSTLEGVGLAMEAIENNTVFYELATDLAWETPELDDWLESFAHQRYRSAGFGQVWRILAETLYGAGRTRSIPSPVIARPWSAALPFAAQRLAGEFVPQGEQPQRPSANIDAENDPMVLGALPGIAHAARLLLTGTPTGSTSGRPRNDITEPAGTLPAAANEALRNDVADLVGHVLAQGTRVHIRGIVAAFGAADADGIDAHLARFRADLLDLDALAATQARSRVGRWIADARAWGDTPAEADVMERDARSLISVWGHQTSGLHDYSGRHWAGLIRDYYLPRWELWASWLAEAVRAGREPDVELLRKRIVAHEEAWRGTIGGYSPDPEGDTLEVATRILDRIGHEAAAQSR